VGMKPSLWDSDSDVVDFQAAVAILGNQPSKHWKARSFVPFLQDFVARGKPVALVDPQSHNEFPEPLNFLPRTARVEYRKSDNLSFLQLLWKIVDYQYVLGAASITPLPRKEGTVTRPAKGQAPKRRSGVFVSYSHKD